jgi:hypothetical protein
MLSRGTKVENKGVFMGAEQISLTAKRFDFAERQGDTFAIAEFKRLSFGFMGHWVVSGKSSVGLPSVLLVLSVPMKGHEKTELYTEASSFAEKFVFPMANHLASTPSAGEPLPRLSVENRQAIFTEHMHQPFSKSRVGGLTLQSQTEALFNMASYLEVVAPLKLIAEFQGVAVSTVETRIKIGRASGAIPKASVVRARKAELEKGN